MFVRWREIQGVRRAYLEERRWDSDAKKIVSRSVCLGRDQSEARIRLERLLGHEAALRLADQLAATQKPVGEAERTLKEIQKLIARSHDPLIKDILTATVDALTVVQAGSSPEDASRGPTSGDQLK